MLKSLNISKFRGFKDVKVEGMDRFNLFLGRNNIGKTALLESLFLLAGPQNPTLTITIIAFRGIEQFRIEAEELWGWLFYEKRLNSTITLSTKLASGAERKLTLSLAEPKQISLKTKAKPKSPIRRTVATATTTSPASDLLMTLDHENGVRSRTRAVLRETGIVIDQEGKKVAMPTGVFVSSRGGYTGENAQRYSKLEEVGKESILIEALQVLEPRLKRLAVLFSAAGPMIHADIGMGHMLPIPILGEGLGRLLTLLLSVASAKGGVVMIDEIETGIHYSAMESIWTAIAKLARELDVQIFTTTHSWECVKAANDSFLKQTPYDFRLHRISRSNGDTTVTTYNKDKIEVALENGMELR